ncbi:hypothetical protein M8J76_015160 [Diaphorina citri]|nr:hypothetical protein M8J76_015160 [Diaphorina citri]
MESDNSSMDGEVNPHWRESLDTKQNHVLEEDQYPAGKGPKSPPENNEHEATSAVSSDSSTQGSPRSQSPSGYNDKQPHTPPNDVAEHNGDHDGDDRLSLSPEPQDRHSLENRERDSRSRSPDNQNEGKPSSPALSEAKSPRATDNASPPPRRRTLDSPDKVPVSKSLAEDLSDVSDIESDGNDNDILNADDDRDSGDEKRKRNQINGGVTMTLAVTEEEQLDFEEEPEEREDGEEEEGECDKPPGKDTDKNGGDGGVEMKGKKEEEELEEGEVSDEGETRPEESEPRPICRFYSRGACTWGSSCRFLHPGVTDKGHYTMFDMIRPMAAPPLAHGPYHAPLRPPEHYGPPPGAVLEPRVPGGAALLPPVVRSKEDPSAPLVPGAVPTAESAWERGLRQAKEILKKSTKRKETEVDFEEKKMNLTLGQDELDKENDYYTR